MNREEYINYLYKNILSARSMSQVESILRQADAQLRSQSLNENYINSFWLSLDEKLFGIQNHNKILAYQSNDFLIQLILKCRENLEGKK